MGASAKPILFGDPSAAYLLRTDGQPTIVRLNERYMDTLEIGFFLYTRLGGTSIVMSGAPNPLVSIQQAAS
jgi:HK97 family phage major capsid protein